MESSDIIVIGGGIIGASVAYGVAKLGVDVTLLDQGGSTYSASRGNFGLAWVQGKGLGMPSYAEWTLDAVQGWPEFSEDLREKTGISVDFEQSGGFEVCFGEKELCLRKSILEQIRQESKSGFYDYEMLDHQTIQEMIPKLRLGKTVSGASFSPHDAHLNPLALLRGLLAALSKTHVCLALFDCHLVDFIAIIRGQSIHVDFHRDWHLNYQFVITFRLKIMVIFEIAQTN